MAQFVYVTRDLSKYYEDRQVLKDISLSFLPGAKIGVIGHNGAGKSTLLKIMAGLDQEFEGEASPAKGIKVGYLPQEPRLNPDKTVLENIMEGVAEKQALVDKYNEVSMRFEEDLTPEEMDALIAEQAELQEEIDAGNLWDLEREIEIAMNALNCPPGDATIKNLSGGETRRVAICRLVLERPDMMLLDEPTNHLDAESVAWLERYLKDYSGTVIVITHDRYFLDNVTNWILELDRGVGIPWEGNYSTWLDQRGKRLRVEEKKESARQKQLASELEWIRKSAKGRQAKSKARIKSYEDLLQQTQDKVVGPAQIVIPPGPKLGNQVMEAESLFKAFEDRILIENLSFRLPRGGIVGVIGPNGAGKTTLLKMITGKDTPDQGSLTIGETVKVGYAEQLRDGLADENSVWQEISNGDDEILLGKRTVKSRAYCASFNFKGTNQQQKIGSLSGGERNRVLLAKMLRQNVNLLLLDEPTNDLDVDTLRALEEALLDFAGCAVVVSHDRWFLDRIATHILAFEGDSQVVWFEGNYEMYEKDRKERLGDSFFQPKRLNYKKLTN